MKNAKYPHIFKGLSFGSRKMYGECTLGEMKEIRMQINESMVSAGLVVLEEALAWPDYPYTNAQMVEAILRAAMPHYAPPAPASAPAKNRSQADRDGLVYFVGDGAGAIKIGKATNVKSRLSGLQTGHSRKLTCLGVKDGGRRSERELHRMFKKHHLHGEWFKDCQDIRDCIARECRPFEANDNKRGRPRKVA